MKQATSLLLVCVCLVGCKKVAPVSDARPAPPRSTPTSRPVAASQPAAPASQPAAAQVPRWELSRVGNLKRLGELTARQQELLRNNGFFLAPPPPVKRRRGIDRATHLFHVYERNDYIAFPSLVTADLAIDTTHAYFNAVLKEVEADHVVPRLRRGLRALLAEAVEVHRAARSEVGRQAARRAVAFWGVALQLLEAPARGDAPDAEMKENVIEREAGEEPAKKAPGPRHRRRAAREVPATLRPEVEAAVQAIQAGGTLPAGVLRAPVDLTQFRPRGHYNRTGVLQRYFRAMSWLGMASFRVKGPTADLPALTLLVRSWLGSARGRGQLQQVLALTTFFVGGADAADLDAAAKRVKRVLPNAGEASADQLAAAEVQGKLAAAMADLPAPRVELSATAPTSPPQVRVMGRRAFEDTLGMQEILKPLMTAVEQGREARILPPAMGALGSAAVLGSELARREVLAATPAGKRGALDGGIARGRELIAKVPAARWGADAYHGTLHGLRPLLDPLPESAPSLLRTEAWRLRMLQAFAAGWAELRHDTILYGEQLGAECDAPEPPPPPGWVEPLPEVYARLSAMVVELGRRLKQAGITGKKGGVDENPFYRPLPEKAEMLLKLLGFLREVSQRELAGKPLTREQRQEITLIGGQVEWIMITLADTDLLAARDQDMAVVADVFTWRPTRQVVEVAVAHPDLIYGIIPGPRGKPVVARGAVMSYRAFLKPQDRRMTDEAWREQLRRGAVPTRPGWLDAIYAEPLPAIKLRGQGVDRCGVRSGFQIEL